MAHRWYFDRGLEFNDKYRWHNICMELPLELTCQLLGTWLGWLAADKLTLIGPGLLTKELFDLVCVSLIVKTLIGGGMSGQDSNHIPYTTVPKGRSWFLVDPQ